MRRIRSVTVVAACVVAVLTSCSSDSSDGSSADQGRADASGSRTASVPSKTATPSPSPTGPCADGHCEGTVAVGDTVVVPEKYGLGPIEVTAIGDERVDMAVVLFGLGFCVVGCSGGGGVSL